MADLENQAADLRKQLENRTQEYENLHLNYQSELMELEEENEKLRQLSDDKILRMLANRKPSVPMPKVEIGKKLADIETRHHPLGSKDSERREDTRPPAQSLQHIYRPASRPYIDFGESKPSMHLNQRLNHFATPTGSYKQVRIVGYSHEQTSIQRPSQYESPLSLKLQQEMYENAQNRRCIPLNSPSYMSASSKSGAFGSPKVSMQDNHALFFKYYKAGSEIDDFPLPPSSKRNLNFRKT